MTDRCETCGWWNRELADLVETAADPLMGECRRETPVHWSPALSTDGCGEHTAVQRRRDRLMLAGQALASVHAIAASTPEAMNQRKADIALGVADAVLERADG